MSLVQSARDQLQYSSGYLSGRFFALPSSLSDLYGRIVSKATSLATLPLPLLSFLVLPFYGGSSTTVSLVFFYLTWSALVLSHSPLTIEVYGTLVVRMLCFVLPALATLAFDCALPKLGKSIKARGARQLPLRLGRDKVLKIAGIAVCNVLLTILLQLLLEQLFTKILHMRSLLKVTTTVPLPLTIIFGLVKGFVARGVLHYVVHRYLLHSFDTRLKAWHLSWQHSIDFTFSLVAAYDHPVNYLLASWIPAILPAYLMRFHVLTWHLFLALISLEELFIFSGYSVLPSTIILSGMARRIEAHFDSVQAGKAVGNFGHLGVLDLVMGTTCQQGSTVVEDFQDEAEKRQFQERIDDAVNAALEGIQQKKSKKGGSQEVQQTSGEDENDTSDGERKEETERGESGEAYRSNAQSDEPAPRRSGRAGRRKGSNKR